MNRLRYWIRNFFGATQTQANGFIAVIILLLFLIVFLKAQRWYDRISYEPSPMDTTRLDSLAQLLDQAYAETKSNRKNYKKPKKVKPQRLFAFDPNQIGLEEWETLGLPTYVAKNIIKYRQKGGSFKIKKDLLKIYNFPEDLYPQLEPYIQLPSDYPKRADFAQKEEKPLPTELPERTASKRFERPVIAPFNLNRADTSQLKQVRGIGSVLSARIVKFRDGLGGFHSLLQLNDVYGLKPEVVEELLKYAKLESGEIHKFAINQADEKELAKHPYISKKLAKVLVNYRSQHGKYQQPDDLLNIRILDQKTYEKLIPYLSF